MPEPTSEQRDAQAARLTAAEREARAARAELEQLRSRRGVQIALVLASVRRRPWRILQLPRLLATALARTPRAAPGAARRAGGAPDGQPADQPGRDTSRGLDRLAPAAAEPSPGDGEARQGAPDRGGDSPPRLIPDEPPPYPHLDVAHLPAPGTFAGLARDVAADPEAWRAGYDGGADVLVLEPAGAPDRVDADEVARLLAACRDDEVPAVLLAASVADLAAPWTADVDVVVTDDPAVAGAVEPRGGRARALPLPPAVDARAWNPVGWEWEPGGGVLCVVGAVPDEAAAGPLGALLADPPADLTVRVVAGVDPTALPDRLRDRVEPDADRSLADAVRGHRAVLAMPELHASEPAFLRHVLAVVACGTPVVASPVPALASLLPGDAVRFAAGPEEARAALAELVDDPDVRERRSVRARRHVLTHHTVRDRFDAVLEALGIPTAEPEHISVLLATHRSDFLERAIDNVARQRWQHKELVVVLHGDGPDPARVAALTERLPFPTRVVAAPGHWTFGDCLNAGLAASTGELVAKMDDDDLYGPDHLTDLVAARRYARADVVGKWAQFVYLEQGDVTLARQTERQERLGTHLPGPTFLIARDLLRRFGFSRVDSAIDTALWRRLRAAGGRLYSTHRYNFIRVRHGEHTFQRSDEEFLASADSVVPGLRRDVLEV